MIRKIDRWALVLSYVLLVASVFTIGWITEHNSTQTQERQCAIFRAQILVNTELALYMRSIREGVAVPELDPTKTGQLVASDIRKIYSEVCDGSID